MEEMKNMNGTVKWFNVRKGYGFVEGEDGQDYFVHMSAVPDGVTLNEGDKVNTPELEENLYETERGKQAQKIALA